MHTRSHLLFAGIALLVLALLIAALFLGAAPGPVELAVLGLGAACSFGAAAAHVALARRRPTDAATESDTLQERLDALAYRESQVSHRAHRLEVREQRLSRQLRVLQLADHDRFVDVVDSELSPHAIERLVQQDQALLALIERRSQQAFDDLLANRYSDGDGVDLTLMWQDLGNFIESVARLYQPQARDPLLETEIELVAKATSSTALHLLLVVDALPLDLKSYNAATMYRTLRRAADYYGTWKQVKPYLDAGLSVLQVARFALGVNPVAVGASWVAGKLAAQGAQKVTEQLLHRQVLQLLQDAIRVIAFEVAMVYGGGFRRRDANWFLGAELVNLELLRGDDLRGRDQALRTLCTLSLRHEFDRLLLLRQLGSGQAVALEGAALECLLTPGERGRIVEALRKHCDDTEADLTAPGLVGWQEALESRLAATGPEAGDEAAPDPQRSGPRLPRPRELLERLRRMRP
ncbi:MAG: hypothetical protein AAFX85_12430, partial [Pseudomonadota bacterium]